MPPCAVGDDKSSMPGTECRAISSGVERHVDIVEVAGSRPASPTNPGFRGQNSDPTSALRAGNPKLLRSANRTPDYFGKTGVSTVVSWYAAI